MRLYKGIWKFYGDIALLDRWWEEFTDRFPEYLWNNYDHKCYARELKVIYLSVEALLKRVGKNTWYDYCENRKGIAEACEAIHKKYWERFHRNFYGKWVKRDTHIPHMNKTKAIREFLAMGFVYKTDMTFDHTKYYYVYAHIGGLWWPKGFDSHQDAIAIQTKYGIPGLTGTTILKTK
jgi:hypothetical protein